MGFTADGESGNCGPPSFGTIDGEKKLRLALRAILDEIESRKWILDGRGSYEWDDDRYRQETRWVMEAVTKIANDALRS